MGCVANEDSAPDGPNRGARYVMDRYVENLSRGLYELRDRVCPIAVKAHETFLQFDSRDGSHLLLGLEGSSGRTPPSRARTLRRHCIEVAEDEVNALIGAWSDARSRQGLNPPGAIMPV